MWSISISLAMLCVSACVAGGVAEDVLRPGCTDGEVAALGSRAASKLFVACVSEDCAWLVACAAAGEDLSFTCAGGASPANILANLDDRGLSSVLFASFSLAGRRKSANTDLTGAA
jgi:hypothetical protein